MTLGLLQTTPNKWRSMARSFNDNNTHVYDRICAFPRPLSQVLMDPTQAVQVDCMLLRHGQYQESKRRATITFLPSFSGGMAEHH
jgi:hypothetical protein